MTKEEFLSKFDSLIDEYMFDNKDFSNIDEAFERKIPFKKESFAIELSIEKLIIA